MYQNLITATHWGLGYTHFSPRVFLSKRPNRQALVTVAKQLGTGLLSKVTIVVCQGCSLCDVRQKSHVHNIQPSVEGTSHFVNGFGVTTLRGALYTGSASFPVMAGYFGNAPHQ